MEEENRVRSYLETKSKDELIDMFIRVYIDDIDQLGSDEIIRILDRL